MSDAQFICPVCESRQVESRRNVSTVFDGSDPRSSVLLRITCAQCHFEVPAHLGERWDGLSFEAAREEWNDSFKTDWYVPSEKINCETLHTDNLFAIARRGADMNKLKHRDLFSALILDAPDAQSVWMTERKAAEFVREFLWHKPCSYADFFFTDPEPFVAPIGLDALRRYLRLNPPFIPDLLIMESV